MKSSSRSIRIDPDTWQNLSASEELDGWFAELADPNATMRATAAFTLGFVPKRRRPQALRALRLALDDADEMVPNRPPRHSPGSTTSGRYRRSSVY